MKTSELKYVLKTWFPQMYTVVCPVHQLDLSHPGAYIVNTDCNKGRHWVAFYVTETTLEFFDSYGRHPKDLQNCTLFLKAIGDRPLIVYPQVLQAHFKRVCGVYCLAFLFARIKWNDVSKLYALMSHDRNENDCKIVPIVNSMIRSMK